MATSDYDKWRRKDAIGDFLDPHHNAPLLRLLINFPGLLKAVAVLGIGLLIFCAICSALAPNGPTTTSTAAVAAYAPPVAAPALVPAPVVDVIGVNQLGQVAHDADVTADPAPGDALATIHEGHPVHLIGKAGDWLKVRLHDGREGWITADAAEVVGDWIGSAPESNGSP
jgi:Bacterial SH3 domain